MLFAHNLLIFGNPLITSTKSLIFQLRIEKQLVAQYQIIAIDGNNIIIFRVRRFK